MSCTEYDPGVIVSPETLETVHVYSTVKGARFHLGSL